MHQISSNININPNNINHIIPDLNAEQISVAQTIDRPIIVIAGAGTGKTKTIVSKIQHHILNNIAEANKIIAVTFTNKAAAELRHRLYNVSHDIRIGTFHRISMNIIHDLREKHDNLPDYIKDIKPTAILTGDEQLAIVKQILHKFNTTRSPYSHLQNIQAVKECGRMIRSSEEQAIFDAYETELLKSHMFDFSDILLKLIQLWECNHSILQECRDNVQLLCVDEYQDINDLQFRWINLLYHQKMQLCCVGDADQSIYGFRGANIQHILNFNKTFPNAITIKLEVNYRSTKDILDKANALVKYNKNRIEKNLKTNSNSDKISVHLNKYASDVDEANEISKRIQSSEDVQGSIAILIRAKQQSQSIEASLLKYKIPYVLTGLFNFADRAEVKDIISYLKFANNHYDSISFKRSMLSPRRGIGEVTINNIIQTASQHGISIYEAAKGMNKQNIQDFLSIIDHISNIQCSVDYIIKYVYNKSGYCANIDAKKDNILQDWFNTLPKNQSISEYLESLLWQEQAQEQSSSVHLMTIHASKGLEFDYVFLPGWEENIMPHVLSQSPYEIEEERRLAYVAITRARYGAFISHCRQRIYHGKFNIMQPSRFIQEAYLSASNVNLDNSYAATSRGIFSNESPAYRYHKQYHTSDGGNHISNADNIKKTHSVSQSTNSTPIVTLFNAGDMVEHKKFGLGMVIECGSSHAKVQFMHTSTIIYVKDLMYK